MTQNTIRPSLYGFEIKEDGTYRGLFSTTHADRVGDIVTKEAIEQVVTLINSPAAGGAEGAYRMVSFAHDWVRKQDPTLDPVAFLVPGTAKLIPLADGHFGGEVTVSLNEHYRGEMPIEEVRYRIEQGDIAGLSIEYKEDPETTTKMRVKDSVFRVIRKFAEFGGVGLARARMICNPQAVFYKEIENYMNNDQPEIHSSMSEDIKQESVEPTTIEPSTQEIPVEESIPVAEQIEETNVQTEVPLTQSPTTVITPVVAEEVATTTPPATQEPLQKPIESKELSVKELLQTKEFKEEVSKNIQVKTKSLKTNREDSMAFSVKELNAALLSKDNTLSYKEAVSQYVEENGLSYKEKLETYGTLPLRTTLRVKCDGTKLKIARGFELKDTLDTNTNTSAYTQNIVEFADLFQPGIVDTFNNTTGLLGTLQKRDNLEGGNKYGWTITLDRKNGLSVDPNQTAVNRYPVSLAKVQTDMKEYRIGVSVTDYVLTHSRQSLGDLMMAQVEKRMKDLLKDMNIDLFTAQTDTGTKLVGLKALADSANNATLYGQTRSAANRLAPDTASTTYLAVGGALTEANMRLYLDNIQIEGAQYENILIIVGPKQRSALFTLMAARQYLDRSADFGYNRKGNFAYDGIPVLVDVDCPNNQLFIIDISVAFLTFSRPPQMIGLAKIGADQDAYISTYVAHVYEQPRRIAMLDTLS